MQRVLCQKKDAKAYNEPIAPLSKHRVSEAPQFTVTGIDFAGALFCVDLPKTKLYICLFIILCGVVRAVHFLLDYCSLKARRGAPSIIYSANAQTFEAAKAYLV